MRYRLSLAGIALLAACSESPGESGGSAAVASGKTVYENVCIVCHNADPTRRGALGPPVVGSSIELLEAKVLRGEYPPGYTPVQEGATMPKYEFVEPKLADVAAYLATFTTP